MRPDGLERVLVRGGFQVTEADHVPSGRPADGSLPDLILITAQAPDDALKEELGRLSTRQWRGVPTLVLLGSEDREGPTKVLAYGAVDAIASPIHLPEVCARIQARVQGRGDVEGIKKETESSELLFDIFQEASTALRPDEIVTTLVRRVGRGPGPPALFLCHDAGRRTDWPGGGGLREPDRAGPAR